MTMLRSLLIIASLAFGCGATHAADWPIRPVRLIVGFAAGANNAWRAIRVYSDQADKGGNRLP